MRLIDADAFNEFISNHMDFLAPINTEKVTQSEIHKYINNQPTAYDVDKVVNILQQQAEQYHSRAEKYAFAGVNNEVEHMAGKAASYEYAIEIVKAGGIDEKADT